MENEILIGHPAQEAERSEHEERLFQSEEDAEKAFQELGSQVLTMAERESQLLAEQEEREAHEKAEQEFRETARAIRKKHLQATQEFDPDDEGFNDQLAGAWAESDTEIAEARERVYSKPSGPSASTIRYAEGVRDSEAIKAGIDPQDERFQQICSTIPDRGSFEDQVQRAVSTFLNRHGKRPSNQGINSIDDILQANERQRTI